MMEGAQTNTDTETTNSHSDLDAPSNNPLEGRENTEDEIIKTTSVSPFVCSDTDVEDKADCDKDPNDSKAKDGIDKETIDGDNITSNASNNKVITSSASDTSVSCENAEGALSEVYSSKEVPVCQPEISFIVNEPESPEEIAQKRVKIHESIEIHEASDTNSEGEPYNHMQHRNRRKVNMSIKKEIIGILKSPTPSKEVRSFPSLPDNMLKELGILQNIPISTEYLSERDIENKFNALSLAFKTDRVTLTDRLDLQLRQRDIAEKNVFDEIRYLKTTIKSLNRLCCDVDSRDILQQIGKQISILEQSSTRVASSSEQFGAVQQEMRVSTAVEIMLLHLENIKRNFEREHSDLEDAKQVLIKHKLIEGEGECTPRLRSVSVMHGSSISDHDKFRRASVASSSHNTLSVEKHVARPKSPTFLQMVSMKNLSVNSLDTGISEKKSSVFGTITEEQNKNDRNNNNNNSSANNKNKQIFQQRRESRRQSQFDVDTIIEEMDDLAEKRESSPPPSPLHTKKLVLPSSPKELYNRKKSLILHFKTWYSELYWPYDEEETLLGIRYSISAILSVAAFAIVLGTLFG